MFQQSGGASQLYYDIQGTVVDVFTVTAKMRKWCPDRDLYIYQLGSDECEILFCIIRIITHGPNCDFLQLVERMAHSSTLHDIISKHPDWKESSKRLYVSGSVDHTKPEMWTGNNRVGEVDIRKAWNDGRSKAVGLLSSCAWFNGFVEVGAKNVMRPPGKYGGVDDV
jgi:hypothetical protein